MRICRHFQEENPEKSLFLQVVKQQEFEDAVGYLEPKKSRLSTESAPNRNRAKKAPNLKQKEAKNHPIKKVKTPLVVSSKSDNNPPLIEATKTENAPTKSTKIDQLKSPKQQEQQAKNIRKAYIDGNFARRKLPPEDKEYCIWDSELTGFGLIVRRTGNKTFFVRIFERGKYRKIILGKAKKTSATFARSEARRHLARANLDGLPTKITNKIIPTLAEYGDEKQGQFWRDSLYHWKPSTFDSNRRIFTNNIKPFFGEAPLDSISRADINRWRDSFAQSREGSFNRAIPVLSAMLKSAEIAGYRRKGSNPCRGISRYKTTPKERFLTAKEYRRLALILREEEPHHPLQVAIIRLLIFTGARYSEIATLRWEWFKPPRLDLPDSKTGPKIIWLSSQAIAILESLRQNENNLENNGAIFQLKSRGGVPQIALWWSKVRRKAGLADVRIHDLRHSFASTAIMDGVPLATIGRILGHALPETTAKYAHLADEIIADAAARVSGGLAQKLGLTND